MATPALPRQTSFSSLFAVETGAVQGTGAETLRVFPNGCASCEADWLSRSKEAEDAEMARLEELRRENLPELGREIR